MSLLDVGLGFIVLDGLEDHAVVVSGKEELSTFPTIGVTLSFYSFQVLPGVKGRK